MERNQSLFIRKPEAALQAQVVGFNKYVVGLFYNNLFELLLRYKFNATSVWKCGETGNSTVMTPPNVIAKKGTKQVHATIASIIFMFMCLLKIVSFFQVQQTVSAERGDNVTVLAFI